ncbi:MAG: hypothetical protein HQ515_22090, partial [Phycisphaeraceae bacterium]|nr:hypothetical protein [Phycisphaeraceae bacterium]
MKFSSAQCIMMLICLPALLTAQPRATTSHVTVWDTMTPLSHGVDSRSQWQAVPTDLLTLEQNPAAATADPSHYGRAYAFAGDTVIENAHVIAACLAREGRVAVYAKADLTKQVEIMPLQIKGKRARITHCSILQNTGDDATLEISFSAEGTVAHHTALVSLGRTGTLAIKPTANMTGVSLASKMEYGVVPSFIGDDLIFSPKQFP